MNVTENIKNWITIALLGMLLFAGYYVFASRNAVESVRTEAANAIERQRQIAEQYKQSYLQLTEVNIALERANAELAESAGIISNISNEQREGIESSLSTIRELREVNAEIQNNYNSITGSGGRTCRSVDSKEIEVKGE